MRRPCAGSIATGVRYPRQRAASRNHLGPCGTCPLSCRIISQIRRKPPLDLSHAHPLAFGIVFDLIAVNLAQAEIAGFPGGRSRGRLRSLRKARETTCQNAPGLLRHMCLDDGISPQRIFYVINQEVVIRVYIHGLRFQGFLRLAFSSSNCVSQAVDANGPTLPR